MTIMYDLTIIGGGPGGYVAAIKAAQSGLSTALIEKGRLGGTCLNRGCIPAKAMIHASDTYLQALNSEACGIIVDKVSIDYPGVLKYKQETVDALVSGVEGLLKANKIDVIQGTGKLLAPSDGKNRVEVDGEKIIESDKVILASGSKPARIPVPGIDHPKVLTSDGLFALEELPESLVIIGGGVIGVEFATAFSALGTKVTIIEALPKILDNFDKEISQNLKMILKKRGVDIHTSAQVKEIKEDTSQEVAETVSCVYVEKDKEQTASGQYILCAAGRTPETEDLLAEDLKDDGVAFEGKFIKTDENMMTGLPGVYAIGDVAGGIQLAHAASAQGLRAVEHMIHGPGEDENHSSLDLKVIPGCVYTSPEIASVGMTEVDAKDNGYDVITGKFIMSANGKSLITKEERGFIKVVIDNASKKILGAQMMCARATDMIGEFTTAIVNDMTAAQMLKGVRAHPTYNEAITEAIEDALGGSIHTMPKRRP